ncbi:MAG TPA: hypothetical protein DDY98_08930 [Ruminococcaceae bacterium]|nr:hypothetical protein [Oscillospiraceae bacterium]
MKKTFNKITRMPTKTIVLWWVCRAALLVWGLLGLFQGYTSEFLQALFSVAFTHLWDLFQIWGGKSFITQMPYQFQTDLNLFITLGVCVGSTLNNRTDFTGSDIVTHFFAGLIAARWCAEMLVIMQEKKGTHIAPAIAAMGGFGMALAILVGWEIYEFTMDRLYGFTLQMSDPFSEEGLVDTMTDFIIGAAGSLAGMFVFVAHVVKQHKKAD